MATPLNQPLTGNVKTPSGATVNATSGALVAPPVTPTMDASSLSVQTPGLTLAPKSQVSPVDVSNLISSTALTALPGTAPAATPAVPTPGATPAAPTTPSLTERLSGLIGKGKERATDLATSIETETSPYTTQLNEINTQIKMHQANSIARQERALQMGETSGFASREAQNVARTDAIEALKLSAIAEGMRGNIALAEQHATNAINAKYAAIDKDIEDARAAIYDNYDTFSAAEKKKADATLLRLDKEDTFVKDRKEEDKITQGFIQQAIATSQKNGKPIDTLTLRRANEAETATEALQILAPYMEDLEAKQEALLDRQYKQAQIRKLGAEAIEAGGGPTVKISSADGKKTVSVSSTTQAIIDNPSLFDDLTPTERGKVITQLQSAGYDTKNLGVKALSDTAIKEISQTQKALDDLAGLKTLIGEKSELLGPVRGLARLNPFSETRKLQADVNRVRQTVGKALEGGVLRKEDEEKYKQILATLSDTPSTALYKIDALIGSIQRDIQTYKGLQQGAGRSLDVSGSLQKKGETTKPEDLRKKYNY